MQKKKIKWEAPQGLQQLKKPHLQNYVNIIKYFSSVLPIYIIKYFSFKINEEGQKQHQLQLVMEKGQPYSPLKQWYGIQRKKVSAQSKHSFILELCRAMKEISSYKILHTDLSERNIVFVNGKLKLIDFQSSLLIDEDYRIDKENQEIKFNVQKKALTIGTFILKEQILRLYSNQPSNLFERMKNRQQKPIEEISLIQEKQLSLQEKVQKHFNLMVKNVAKTNAFCFATLIKTMFSQTQLNQIDQSRRARARGKDRTQEFQTLQALLQQMSGYSVKERMELTKFQLVFQVQQTKQLKQSQNRNQYVQKLNFKMGYEKFQYIISQKVKMSHDKFQQQVKLLEGLNNQLRDKGILNNARKVLKQCSNRVQTSKQRCFKLDVSQILEQQQQQQQQSNSQMDQNCTDLRCFSKSKKYSEGKFQFYMFNILNLRFLRNNIHSQRFNKIRNFAIFQDIKNKILIQYEHPHQQILELDIARSIVKKGFKFVLKTFEYLCQGVIFLQGLNIFYPALTLADIIITQDQQIKIGSLHKTIPLLSIDQIKNNVELSCFTGLFFKLYCEILQKVIRKKQNPTAEGNSFEDYQRSLLNILFYKLQQQTQNNILNILKCLKPGQNGVFTHFQRCKKAQQVIFELRSAYQKHHSKSLGQIFKNILDEYEKIHPEITNSNELKALNQMIAKLNAQNLDKTSTCQAFFYSFSQKYQFCRKRGHQNQLLTYTPHLQNEAFDRYSAQQLCDKCLEPSSNVYEYLCIRHKRQIKYRIQFCRQSFRNLSKYCCQWCISQNFIFQKVVEI